MGNHKFRLSNMMPNAWFYKLKDMNKPISTTKTHQKQLPKPYVLPSRPSYYFPSNSPIHPKALDDPFPLESPRTSNGLSHSYNSDTEIIFDFTSNTKLAPINTKLPKNKEIHNASPRSLSKKAKLLTRRRKQKSLLAKSILVIKKSKNPRKDFKKSMMEMIMENDMKKVKDLEELLACYLSLNSDEYHDVIVEVFQDIWVDVVVGCAGV